MATVTELVSHSATSGGGRLQLGLLGVNHKSARIELREQLARAFEHCFHHQRIGKQYGQFVLLSTCNRTEVYFSSEDLAATHSHFLQVLRNEVGGEFEHVLYSYFNADAFYHLARVTAGLDSAVLGETEIQGQVKNAYQGVSGQHPLTKEIHFVFQKSLKVGKQVRYQLLEKKGMPDLQGAVYKMAEMILGDLSTRSVLFIGASEINLKLLSFLRAKKIPDITLCNRTLERAQEVARQESVRCLDWSQLSQWTEYDCVVVGTKASNHLLQTGHLEGAKQLGKRLLIDFSHPRNIDPQLGQHPKTLLFNIDQIGHAVDSARAEHALLLKKAEEALVASIDRQIHLFDRREQNRLLHSVVGA